MDLVKNKKLVIPLFLDAIRWWWSPVKYGAVNWLLHFWKLIIFYTIDLFSIRVLVPALITFQPWKRDNHWVGRLVGFFVRLMFIMIGLFGLIVVLLIATLTTLFWIVLPFLGSFRFFSSILGALGYQFSL